MLDGAAARGAVGQQLVLDGRLLGVLEARAQDHGVVGVAERAQQGRRRRGLTVGQRELGHLRNIRAVNPIADSTLCHYVLHIHVASHKDLRQERVYFEAFMIMRQFELKVS